MNIMKIKKNFEVAQNYIPSMPSNETWLSLVVPSITSWTRLNWSGSSTPYNKKIKISRAIVYKINSYNHHSNASTVKTIYRI